MRKRRSRLTARYAMRSSSSSAGSQSAIKCNMLLNIYLVQGPCLCYITSPCWLLEHQLHNEFNVNHSGPEPVEVKGQLVDSETWKVPEENLQCHILHFS